MGVGYDSDLLVWSGEQADLLRRLAAGERVNDQIDWLNVAEEIEAGKSDRRELHRRIATVLLHLIKLQASPAAGPRASWRETVREQRSGIQMLLDDSSRLRPLVPDIIGKLLIEARKKASASLADRGEEPGVDLAGLRYTDDQVLGPWLP